MTTIYTGSIIGTRVNCGLIYNSNLAGLHAPIKAVRSEIGGNNPALADEINKQAEIQPEEGMEMSFFKQKKLIIKLYVFSSSNCFVWLKIFMQTQVKN